MGFAEALSVSLNSWWGVKILTQRCNRRDNMGNNNPVSAVTSNQNAESSDVLEKLSKSSLHTCIYAQYLEDLTTCTGNGYQVAIFTLPAAAPQWSGDVCCSCSVLVLARASLFVKSVGGQYGCFFAQQFECAVIQKVRFVAALVLHCLYMYTNICSKFIPVWIIRNEWC